MYHMQWKLEDVRRLSLMQFNWIVRQLEEQKNRERQASRGR